MTGTARFQNSGRPARPASPLERAKLRPTRRLSAPMSGDPNPQGPRGYCRRYGSTFQTALRACGQYRSCIRAGLVRANRSGAWPHMWSETWHRSLHAAVDVEDNLVVVGLQDRLGIYVPAGIGSQAACTVASNRFRSAGRPAGRGCSTTLTRAGAPSPQQQQQALT